MMLLLISRQECIDMWNQLISYLDGRVRLVGVGVHGMLCSRWPCLARGIIVMTGGRTGGAGRRRRRNAGG
jgi:hypothetical protein